MGFNVALRLAYEDITGVTSSEKPATRAVAEMPVGFDHTGLMQPRHGRFGNVIYLGEDRLN